MNLFKFFTLLSKKVVTTAATTTATTATTTKGGDISNIKFEPHKFLDMLGYMGTGMLVIFVLIGVIILVTLLINKVFSKKQ